MIKVAILKIIVRINWEERNIKVQSLTHSHMQRKCVCMYVEKNEMWKSNKKKPEWVYKIAKVVWNRSHFSKYHFNRTKGNGHRILWLCIHNSTYQVHPRLYPNTHTKYSLFSFNFVWNRLNVRGCVLFCCLLLFFAHWNYST